MVIKSKKMKLKKTKKLKRSRQKGGSIQTVLSTPKININNVNETEFAKLPNVELHEKLQIILNQTQRPRKIDDLPPEEKAILEEKSKVEGKSLKDLLRYRNMLIFHKRKLYIDEIAHNNPLIKSAIEHNGNNGYATDTINEIIQNIKLSAEHDSEQEPVSEPIPAQTLLQYNLSNKKNKKASKKNAINKQIAEFKQIYLKKLQFFNKHYKQNTKSNHNSKAQAVAEKWFKQKLTTKQAQNKTNEDIEYIIDRQ